MSKRVVDTSKFLSFVLRHRPDAIGLVLDSEGWVGIDALIVAAHAGGKRVDRALIEEVVATNDKQRFAISADGLRIRAVQGHSSAQVDIRYAAIVPPAFLYHGTASRFLQSIGKQGLIAGARHHVHLSDDEKTAVQVGARHGMPVVLKVLAAKMHAQGFVFYRADNGVWLTAQVPISFIERT
ncbi:MAG: RNA 2'-phosphotransferase [Pseudomonadota bacterium]|nr:RNA 2'-phosphotransferase [Pseudomonadota bacterium]